MSYDKITWKGKSIDKNVLKTLWRKQGSGIVTALLCIHNLFTSRAAGRASSKIWSEARSDQHNIEAADKAMIGLAMAFPLRRADVYWGAQKQMKIMRAIKKYDLQKISFPLVFINRFIFCCFR